MHRVNCPGFYCMSVRVMRGIVLFVDDHLSRLALSARLAGVSLPVTPQKIASDLQRLVAGNNMQEGNIRLLFRFGKESEYLAYVIPHHYPSEEDYACGVRVGLLEAERTRPNAKIVQPALRSRANDVIAREKLYEVLLVHSLGYITEGSRSNFFALKNGTLYTAPLTDVLGGITREHVLRVCARLEIPVVEECICLSDLQYFESAFLTGTSPQVLPVSMAGNISFNVDHPLLRRIMVGYARYLEEYLMHFM